MNPFIPSDRSARQPYPLIIASPPPAPLEPVYTPSEPCVLSTQPTPPSFLPPPPVTQVQGQWVQASAPYAMPMPPSLLCPLKPEMPSPPKTTPRQQLLLDQFLEPPKSTSPPRSGSGTTGTVPRSAEGPSVRPKVLSPGLVCEEGHSPRVRDAEKVASLFEDNKTTVMMRNIPNRYTCEELLSEVMAAGFDSMFDFFYLPMDFKTKRNRGYGFINFQSSDIAKDFARNFHHRQLLLYSSRKIVEVAPAVTQGYEANMSKYFEKDSERIKNDWFRPMLFSKK